jgi:hypothetical protein
MDRPELIQEIRSASGIHKILTEPLAEMPVMSSDNELLTWIENHKTAIIKAAQLALAFAPIGTFGHKLATAFLEMFSESGKS